VVFAGGVLAAVRRLHRGGRRNATRKKASPIRKKKHCVTSTKNPNRLRRSGIARRLRPGVGFGGRSLTLRQKEKAQLHLKSPRGNPKVGSLGGI